MSLSKAEENMAQVMQDFAVLAEKFSSLAITVNDRTASKADVALVLKDVEALDKDVKHVGARLEDQIKDLCEKHDESINTLRKDFDRHNKVILGVTTTIVMAVLGAVINLVVKT